MLPFASPGIRLAPCLMPCQTSDAAFLRKPAPVFKTNTPSRPPSVPHPSPMSGHRLSRCLIVIGWNERELARRTGRHQTQVRRWIKGESAIPPPVAAWITDLADFVVAHPGPRLVSACPAKG